MPSSRSPYHGIDRRSFIAGIAALGVMATLTSCSKEAVIGTASSDTSSSGSGNSPFRSSKKILSFAINNPASIDPYNCYDSWGAQICSLLFDSLTAYDDESSQLLPAAAESWEMSEDAKVFTFNLVHGASFHNGETVTASNFKMAWERIANPKTKEDMPSQVAHLLSPIVGYDAFVAQNAKEISGIKIVDEYTLQVSLSYSYADFPLLASHPALAPVPEVAEDFNKFFPAPVGNGPFRMDGYWIDGQFIKVLRYDDYYGESAALDGINFMIYKNQEASYVDFNAGNLDFAPIPLDKLPWVLEAAEKEAELQEQKRLESQDSAADEANKQSDAGGTQNAENANQSKDSTSTEDAPSGESNTDTSNVANTALEDKKEDDHSDLAALYSPDSSHRLLIGPEHSCLYLVFNTEDELLSDPRIRKAISLAIDRQELIDTLYQGLYKPSSGGLIPSTLNDRVKTRFEVLDKEEQEKLAEEAAKKKSENTQTETENNDAKGDKQQTQADASSSPSDQSESEAGEGNEPGIVQTLAAIDVAWDCLRFDPDTAAYLLGQAGYGDATLYEKAYPAVRAKEMLQRIAEEEILAAAENRSPRIAEIEREYAHDEQFRSPELALPKITLLSDGEYENKQLVDLLSGYLRKLGFSVRVEAAEWTVFLQKLKEGKFQAAPLSWIAEYPSADVFLKPLLQSASSGNISRYSDADFDQKLLDAISQIDERKRLNAFQQLDQSLGDSAPIVPLFEYNHHHVASDRVSGMYFGRDSRAKLETASLI